MSVTIVTLDGLSGVGKGSVARQLAARFGWHLLDSGALYRLTALAAVDNALALEDEGAVAALARELDIEFRLNPAEELVTAWLAGVDVSAHIRSETVGKQASMVAALPAVREALLQRQRDFASPPGLVADGRDMGTTIFPKADYKFFLTASSEVRAKRRYKQLNDKGLNVTLSGLVRDIEERDRRDSQRSVSPVRPAEDALVIDTSQLTLNEVVSRVVECMT
ncbi:(d)CMP kinase [Ectothiorhodospiraceae bacterium BW-2]|nr:(d)CMP kinase [Ectothiorhodospiraceae bacterium BW-2]